MTDAPGFELWAAVEMGVVCFRAVRDGPPDAINRFNAAIAAEVNRQGAAYLTHTTIRGCTVLRIALGNILTEERHLARLWGAVQTIAAEARTRTDALVPASRCFAAP